MSSAAPSPIGVAVPRASTLGRQALAEFLGTAALLCAVIGSGIMAERLSGGNAGLALLANTLATVFALYVLIETLGPVSGAHFNPLVTLLLGPPGQAPGRARWRAVAVFVAAQLAGALLGAWLANAMFELPLLQISTRQRAGAPFGWGPWLAEAVATASLLFVIVRSGAAGVQARASALVACTIGAAYWFTASTSFANPAAVFGRMFSDSFAGIAPASAPGFVLAQSLGAWAGVALARRLAPEA
ncbi:MIP/aquaporin family protein [Ramlibacter sp. 2FC]|uniref:aquaporin n=1 Tax=Ramlibacter sp. 2FC TaxID=2502188 RepID=UPI0010F653B8|nr:MIP/aquaporin family protein [Ramlibacter sp. 2FC]